MKKVFFLILLIAGFSTTNAQTPRPAAVVTTDSVQIVEAACGECMFKMKGDDCDLAVRLDGKPYFVDGSKIDDHGDAHAKDGFCNQVRKAAVTGKIVNNRFVATSFKLLPEKNTNGKN